MPKKIIDLTGKTFERLKVLEISPERKNKKVVWKCECKCGNTVDVVGDYLKSGDTKSCGCLKKEQEQINMREKYTGRPLTDLTDQRFGRLVAIRQLEERKNGDSMWECRCDCDEIVIVKRNLLITRQTKSCGCLKKEQDKINLDEKYEDRRIDGVFVPSLMTEIFKNNKSGVKGVHWLESNQKWVAELNVGGERMLRTMFDTLHEATKARKDAEKKYHQPVIDEYNKKRGDTPHSG